MTSPPLLHLAALADWEARSTSHYQPSQFDSEGFVHCCTPDQLEGVVTRYYAQRTDLVLLRLDGDRLDADVRWEDTTGSGLVFPHVYGPIAMPAVVGVETFAPGAARQGDADPAG